ncbi:conserved hypothetical protein [Gloeothece citriformis PCC 7424]|uniref:Uncharacterized protein n=1 Tax=Gloeothece citriformis (strain PCC 7424) TaxID=65393 RepID=B7K708_GLOC7|nr:hypothetical protein [Gloeothece citriformis]ACK72707.1 conserved hypothetical protein [Gloeothece citriformis PCC 7424]
MTITELLPNLQKLSRADKLKVMQFLIMELYKEEEDAENCSPNGANNLINSPYDCFEAADKMNKMLAEYRQSTNV